MGIDVWWLYDIRVCLFHPSHINVFLNLNIISQDARHAAEEEIYTNLNQKIDQFLQLADYDWMTGDLDNKASDYLVDLIAFLRSTFAVFTHLPVSDSSSILPFKVGNPCLTL